MARRQWIGIFLLAATISLFAGCSSSGSGGGSAAPEVSIAFQPAPPTSVQVGSTTTLTAVVANDSTNAGVDWSLTCPNGSGNCGTLVPPHTASGAATTYNTPAGLAGNSLTGINIVAFATADHTKNVVAPLSVTAFGSNLQGTFVLQAQGSQNGIPYQFVGVIVLDGNGGILSGEQTINPGLVAQSDPIIGGTYFLGNDGRGTLTINTGDDSIGSNGIETFSFVYLSSSHALIAQMDLGDAQTGSSAIGTMDLQTTTAPPSGGYAFTLNGFQIARSLPIAFGGVMNIDSPGAISGNGSVGDQILFKTVTANASLSGTLTAPDQFGSLALNLTAAFGTNGRPVSFQLTGYIIDSTHMALIETDNTASASGYASAGGLAVGQGPATGSFKDPTAFSGTFVFAVPGYDLTLNVPDTLTAVGIVTADGSGNLTSGFTDTFLQGNFAAQGTAGAQISAAFDGTYSVDNTGTGRTTLTFADFNPDPKHGYTPKVFFYLTGSGVPPLVLAGGDSHYPSLGTGIAYPQSNASGAFNGSYGFSFLQQNGGENDGTAQMNVNSASAPPSISGLADANLGGGASQDNGFLGTFSSPTSAAPFAGTLYADPNALNGNVFSPPIAGNYYFIDQQHGFFVETDLVSPDPGSAQVSLGYYAARTPVCDGCP